MKCFSAYLLKWPPWLATEGSSNWPATFLCWWWWSPVKWGMLSAISSLFWPIIYNTTQTPNPCRTHRNHLYDSHPQLQQHNCHHLLPQVVAMTCCWDCWDKKCLITWRDDYDATIGCIWMIVSDWKGFVTIINGVFQELVGDSEITYLIIVDLGAKWGLCVESSMKSWDKTKWI